MLDGFTTSIAKHAPVNNDYTLRIQVVDRKNSFPHKCPNEELHICGYAYLPHHFVGKDFHRRREVSISLQEDIVHRFHRESLIVIPSPSPIIIPMFKCQRS
ncbi:hypothetical protein FRX31_008237 [Thalictrum thalictroides]|uniref:Uncharacterized protein n=1 Tax=Thalictrum thalictroides TaxID=46969 RepID=A0A7J6WZA3_THATH|nr:hypothetical protein FRX31_008237 [Thalictrum thalictroides]